MTGPPPTPLSIDGPQGDAVAKALEAATMAFVAVRVGGASTHQESGLAVAHRHPCDPKAVRC